MALGHPKGLFPLFFIEMWERLAFYTMLNVLLLYATDFERGGLGLTTAEGNEIYGLYLAFVYFTPFLGGMFADRFLGYRRAVVIGGLLMAGGLFLMGTNRDVTFFVAGLIGLIVGNGFFKPNISVMVGNLYQAGDPKRDAGFNIFYMGINVGAFAASFLSAGVRNEFGWLWTFWVAGAGLLIGLVILGLNWRRLAAADRQPEVDPGDTGIKDVFLKILAPAFGVGILAAVFYGEYVPDGPLRPPVVGFLAGMIPVIVFFVQMGLRARPDEKPGLLALLPIYVAGGTFFMILHLNGSAMTQWARDFTARDHAMVAYFQQQALPRYYENADPDLPRPHPLSVVAIDDEDVVRMFGLQRMSESGVETIRQQLGEQVRVVTVSVREGAEIAARPDVPSGLEFAEGDPRVVPVYPDEAVEVVQEEDEHGVRQWQVDVEEGVSRDRTIAILRRVDEEWIPAYLVTNAVFDDLYREYEELHGEPPPTMPPGRFLDIVNPEMYQALNPLFVVLFTPLVVGLFQSLSRRGKNVTTARKVFIGLVLTTLSLLVMALAGFLSDDGTVKVSPFWLVGFYAIVTLGELCLSPMGLSLVTKLTPKRLVGLAMGGWFMATAFGNNLSGFFGGIQYEMSPASFFLLLAGLAALASLFILVLLPRLDAAIKKYGA